MKFVNGFNKSIDDRMQVEAIYTDIKAAFDSVSPPLWSELRKSAL